MHRTINHHTYEGTCVTGTGVRFESSGVLSILDLISGGSGEERMTQRTNDKGGGGRGGEGALMYDTNAIQYRGTPISRKSVLACHMSFVLATICNRRQCVAQCYFAS